MRRACGALIISAVAAWSPAALADDIVHFTNGAEMTVRSHTIENDMVKLDLGGSSSITFPIAMVDKIVNAGKNVFLNPAYHPSNQALPVDPGSLPQPLPDRTIRGGGAYAGYRLGQTPTGTGLRLGEVTNNPDGSASYSGSGKITTISDERTSNFTTPRPRHFNPLSPEPIGTKQTIDPPRGSPVRQPETIQLQVSREDKAPTQAPDPATPPPEESAPPQDPPESD